jgi:two-component system, LuxR family, response regulator FixJ
MIYLIDDDPSVRRGFEIFLKSVGYDYRSFECAEEFLLLFKPAKGDLVVLDLTLQGMHGTDLLEKFEENSINIPVIIVTSTDEPGMRERCRKYGVKAFLRKPVDGEALLDLIKFNIQ